MQQINDRKASYIKTFYITTPIYYVNDQPHIGHAYATILADVLARYARLRGHETWFVTGTDEHGQKVQDAARLRGVSPIAFADEVVVTFKKAWQKLHISNDDFIRTTEERQLRVVNKVLTQLWEKGEIYKGEYEGWYCVPDERYWTEKDLLNGNCPDCGRAVERIVEPNYFFRMGKYQEWLIGYINSQPDFIQPEYRRNEVLGFLRQPLGDLCVSRPLERLSWGIPLPFDDQFVTYVWFDALLNYITAAGYGEDPERFERLWSGARHIIGKDILITHSVYWPTMLQAAGLPQPKTIFAHGWWNVRGAKMSKSVGNVVRPLELAEVYGVDALRYFLVSDIVLGRDAEFDETRLALRYEKDLANDLGNLLQRITVMIERYCGGLIPQPGLAYGADEALQTQCEQLPERVFDLLDRFALNQAIETVFESVRETNRYLEQSAPWKLFKTRQSDRVNCVLYHAAESLRLASVLLQPVLPEKAPEIWRRLGWQETGTAADLEWGRLQPGVNATVGPALFPREKDKS